MFYFHPSLGNIFNLTNIFQMGWNNQLVFFVFSNYVLFLPDEVPVQFGSAAEDFEACNICFNATFPNAMVDTSRSMNVEPFIAESLNHPRPLKLQIYFFEIQIRRFKNLSKLLRLNAWVKPAFCVLEVFFMYRRISVPHLCQSAFKGILFAWYLLLTPVDRGKCPCIPEVKPCFTFTCAGSQIWSWFQPNPIHIQI